MYRVYFHIKLNDLRFRDIPYTLAGFTIVEAEIHQFWPSLAPLQPHSIDMIVRGREVIGGRSWGASPSHGCHTPVIGQALLYLQGNGCRLALGLWCRGPSPQRAMSTVVL